MQRFILLKRVYEQGVLLSFSACCLLIQKTIQTMNIGLDFFTVVYKTVRGKTNSIICFCYSLCLNMNNMEMNSIWNVQHEYLSIGWYFLTTCLEQKKQKNRKNKLGITLFCFYVVFLPLDCVDIPWSQRDLICVILLLVDLSQTALTCGCTSPHFPLCLCTKSETVMNLGHLVEGQYC